MFCEEIVKSSGLKCTNKQKLTRDDGKKVCGRHKTTKVVLEKFNKEETKEETIIEEKKENQNKLKMVDLFTGTGAFSYAFESTGLVDVVFANDMVPQSQTIYNSNFRHKLTLGDLNDIENDKIPQHDILTGGFPCQPFSIAGNKKGFNDVRSNVFWKILEIIKEKEPKIVILENVKNLQTHNNKNTFKIIKENLESLNYFIKYEILNTSKISGIPQNRERIYIICFKDKIIYNKFEFNFEKIKNEPIANFLEKTIQDKYYYNNSIKIYDELIKSIDKNIKDNVVYQYRRYYVRENKNNLVPTLTANMGTGGHNVPIILDDKGIRKLTPRECFNFQGFPQKYILPDNISKAGLYKLAGNAVSYPVVKKIAKSINGKSEKEIHEIFEIKRQ